MRIVAISLVLIALVVVGVHSWNCAGHMLTTQVAMQVLPTHIASYFQGISDYQQMYYPRLTSLTEVSCWPDDMKSYTNQYSSWHYYDQCLLRANGTNLTCPPTSDGDLPTALATARAQLANSSTLSMAEKGFWLAYLVHLVGDIHQPLHVTTLFDPQFPRGDLGGNNFMIIYEGSKTNLHSFHDNCGGFFSYGFPMRPLAEYPSNATQIESLSTSLIQFENVSAADANNTNVSYWLLEGFQTGINYSYSLPDGQPLPFNYNVTATSAWAVRLRAKLQYQLALGGRRLATIMQEIYGSLFP